MAVGGDVLHVVQRWTCTAALVYRATGRRTGAPPYRAVVSSVYRREENGWKLLLHQQTPTG